LEWGLNDEHVSEGPQASAEVVATAAALQGQARPSADRAYRSRLHAGADSADLACIENMRSPSDFLDHISWMIDNDTAHFLFDLAVTYFLLRRYPEALRTLRETTQAAERTAQGFVKAGYSDSPVIATMHALRDRAETFSAAVTSDQSAAAEIVSGWERRNIERFDLAGSVAKPLQS
jgi:hypothetical protein